MRTNIILALVILVALFPLALSGMLGLAGIVLIHEAAEVFVILNGVRAAQHPSQNQRFLPYVPVEVEP